MSENDLFEPQIKLDQVTLNQKSNNESVSYSPDIMQEQESFVRSLKNYKQLKTKKQVSKLSNKSVVSVSKTIKTNFLKKFFFNQSFIKSVVQKFIKKSYILQKKFKNHNLLKEECLNDYSMKMVQSNKQLSVIPIIRLNNQIIQIWEVIKLIIYLYFMWMMPFSGVFLATQGPEILDIFDIILFYLILFDIGLRLNKEIIIEGQLISNRRIIFIQFIKNDFIFELIYMFCYTCITYKFLDVSITQIFNICFFFFNLRKFSSCIQNYQESSIIVNDKINLIELIVTVLMLAHFMACIWFYVGTISYQFYQESWILKLNLQNENIFTQYCYSYYWAATTMVTVGYGDITGQNLYEIICSTILLFFSSGIFAFSMNSIGMILNNINQNGQQYRRSLLLINQYMTQNDVSNDLQVKVRNYLQFYNQSSTSHQQKDVNIIIEQLSQNLRLELISDVREKSLQNNTFISQYFSNYTKQQIIQHSESINYTPLEQIYQQKSNDDHSLCIIQKGTINLIDQNSGRIIQQLKEGDSFGELEFLTQQPRYLSAYSKGFSQILKINRDKFLQIIRQNQQDFEQFHMLKDQVLFNLKSPSQCMVCNENHILFQCNKVFYKPDIERVIKQDLFHTYQERQKYKRNKKKNIFELSDHQIIKDCCEAYRFENELESKSKNSFSNSELDSYFSDSQLKTEHGIKAKSNPKTSISQLQQNSNQQSSQNQFQSDDGQKLEVKKHKYRGSQLKQKSNKIVTTLTNINKKKSRYLTTFVLNQLNADQQFKEENNFFQLNSDCQQIYQKYFPNNNYKNVIRIQEKFNRESERQVSTPSVYRFFTIKRMRQKVNYQINLNSSSAM